MILSLFEDLHFDCPPGKSQVLCLEREGASIINCLDFQGVNLSSSVAMLWLAWFGLYAASMVILISPWKTHKVVHIKHHASSISGHFNLSLMNYCRENHSRVERSRSLSPSSRKHNTRKLEPRSHSTSSKYVPNLQIEVGNDKETMEHDHPSWEEFESSSLGYSSSFEPPIIPLSPTGFPSSPTMPREIAMKIFMDYTASTEPEIRTEIRTEIRRRKPNNTQRMSTGIKENSKIALNLISHVFGSSEETEDHGMDGG